MVLVLATICCAEEIQVKKVGDLYSVPVRLNDVLTVDFLIDTGASELCLPRELYSLLKQSGTIKEKHRLPSASVQVADGSSQTLERVLIEKVVLGNITLRDVKTIVGGSGSPLLLGQSVLSQLPNWKLDGVREVLQFSATQTPPALASDPKLAFLELYSGFLQVKSLINRAKYDTMKTGSFSSHLIVAQEKVEEYRGKAEKLIEVGLPEKWQSPISSLMKILERQSSWLNTKSGQQNKTTSARLDAINKLIDEDFFGMTKQLAAIMQNDKELLESLCLVNGKYSEAMFNAGDIFAGFSVFNNSVSVVFEGSSAWMAGMRNGDAILEVDGKDASLFDVQQRVNQPGVHKLRVKDRDGIEKYFETETVGYVPRDYRNLVFFSIVNRGNTSITPAAFDFLFEEMSQRLRSSAGPRDLVIVQWFKAEEPEDSLPEIVKNYRGDFFLSIKCSDYEIRNVARFGGGARMGVIDIDYELYSAKEKKVVDKGSIKEKLDQLRNDPKGTETFSVLKSRVGEELMKRIAGKVSL
ncbi:MAG: retroviral-like aspartic protease family protein [Candidatus Eremiobacteraeota bacterium]|nr:retroviral-like aspartic protease family protein [Candidatus Eremiobacteraeota bacterium]